MAYTDWKERTALQDFHIDERQARSENRRHETVMKIVL
jgi:hypothetical protein